MMENKNKFQEMFCKFYVHCLTTDGIPLFSRTVGENLPTIPFPVIGSLNGVHMFSKSKKVELGCTCTENGKIFWKEYGSVKLIMVCLDTHINEKLIESFVENIYKCLIMSIGETELTKFTNVEKLKRKIKLCLPLLDTFMNPLHLISNITQMTDVVQVTESGILKNYLNAFTEECESEFGCLTLGGRVVVATDKFWQLQTIETSLILYVMHNIKDVTASDTPIYLPNGSPTVPHRLITVALIDNIHVGIVCGPKPSLQEVIDQHIPKYWSGLAQTLRSCLRCIPRGFPPEVKLDPNLLGFILLNTQDGRGLVSVHPHGNNTANDIPIMVDAKQRKIALMNFYFSVYNLFPAETVTEDTKDSHVLPTSDVMETYQCYQAYKCYALKTSIYQLYTLFTSNVPTYTLGYLTKTVLSQIIKDRNY